MCISMEDGILDGASVCRRVRTRRSSMCSGMACVTDKRAVEAWMKCRTDAMNVSCAMFLCDGRAWTILAWIGCKCPMVVVVCMTCATYNA